MTLLLLMTLLAIVLCLNDCAVSSSEDAVPQRLVPFATEDGDAPVRCALDRGNANESAAMNSDAQSSKRIGVAVNEKNGAVLVCICS
mmetsp:Transcript_21834/g.60808  ORF Transcript_21834/g.60808 Transcript_21834/m.60808 type:complete len:87 (+) Transcript_21834:2290-2550(+)